MGVVVGVPLPDAYHRYLGVHHFQILCARRGPAAVVANLQNRATYTVSRFKDALLGLGLAVAGEKEGDVVDLKPEDDAVVVGVLELVRGRGIEDCNINSMTQGNAVSPDRDLHPLPNSGDIIVVRYRCSLGARVQDDWDLSYVVMS